MHGNECEFDVPHFSARRAYGFRSHFDVPHRKADGEPVAALASLVAMADLAAPSVHRHTDGMLLTKRSDTPHIPRNPATLGVFAIVYGSRLLDCPFGVSS